MDSSSQRDPTTDLYSAPRRFDLATMLVVTAAFALLFTGMTVLDFPFLLFAYFAGLISVVGIAQSAFFERYNPRNVSIITGIAYQPLVFLLAIIWGMVSSDRQLYDTFGALTCLAFFCPALGYLAGVLVAGTFLIADLLRGALVFVHLARRRDQEPQDVPSPWDEVSD